MCGWSKLGLAKDRPAQSNTAPLPGPPISRPARLSKSDWRTWAAASPLAPAPPSCGRRSAEEAPAGPRRRPPRAQRLRRRRRRRLHPRPPRWRLSRSLPAARRRPPPSLPPSCGACCGGGRGGRRNRRQSQRQAVRGVGNKEAQQAADPNLHSHAHPRTHRSGCIRSGSDLSAGSARMCR